MKFVTNLTKESKRAVLEKLHAIGFNIKDDQVFTSTTAARNLIDRRKLSPLLLVDDKTMEEFEGLLYFLFIRLRGIERLLLQDSPGSQSRCVFAQDTLSAAYI